MKATRDRFTSKYTDKQRRAWLCEWDKQTKSVLLLANCEHPTFENTVKRQRDYRTGGIQEDELYLMLEGIRLHSTTTKWTTIWADIKLGIYKVRPNSGYFNAMTMDYLKRVGVWEELMKNDVHGPAFIFRRLGYDGDLENIPKYWWLTLSNEFMLGRVRSCNHSCDRQY